MKSEDPAESHSVTYTPERPLERMLFVLGVASLAFSWIFVALHWSGIVRIPTHFGFDGKPDAYGSKAVLLLLPGLSLLLFAAMHVIKRYPLMMNYPVAVTPDNFRHLYELARQMLSWLACEITWLLLYIEIQMVQVAESKSTGLGGAFLAVFIGTIGLTSGWYILAMYRAR